MPHTRFALIFFAALTAAALTVAALSLAGPNILVIALPLAMIAAVVLR